MSELFSQVGLPAETSSSYGHATDAFKSMLCVSIKELHNADVWRVKITNYEVNLRWNCPEQKWSVFNNFESWEMKCSASCAAANCFNET